MAGANTYCYDRNGNMVRRNIGSTYNLTYDVENRLTGVSGGATATFAYDGDGRRVKATVNGVTTAYAGNYYEVNLRLQRPCLFVCSWIRQPRRSKVPRPHG